MTLARRLSLFFIALAVATAAAIGGLAFASTARSLEAEMRLTLADNAAALLDGTVPDGVPPGREDEDAADDPARAQPEPHERAERTERTERAEHTERTGAGRPRRGSLLLAQALDRAGMASAVDGRPIRLPVEAVDVRIAASPSDSERVYRIVTVDGTRYLMLTRSRGHGQGGAVQVARALTERDEVLTRLAEQMAVVAVAVAAAAALAGTFLARRLTRRLVRLTAAAEEVTATGRLDVAVPARGRDEVGRLGAAFDSMLGRLAQSREDQQRLVQDAGHELRTPLTSIRTNISLLRRGAELAADEREAVLEDLAGESRELTALVNELVELTTERYNGEAESEVDLADLADRVAARARRRSGRAVVLDVGADTPTDVRGRSTRLERALSNLVDNAIKFDPGGTEPVEIGVHRVPDAGLRLEVRDRGPGVPVDELGRIFDRFHRATAVRSLPGSGLGLSIVHDVATTHDGSVFAANRPGGGAVVGFTLPADRLQPGSNPR